MSKFLDQDRGGFAEAMTCLGLYADERGGITALTSLQACGEFEGMTWHDAVIMIASGNEGGRVDCAGFEIVIR